MTPPCAYASIPRMTKTTERRIRVEERALARNKARESAFMRKSYNIYRGQQMRLREVTGDAKATLPYTLELLRECMRDALNHPCFYCGGKLTIKTITADHGISIADGGSWTMMNLFFPCQPCNWRKGRWSAEEFQQMKAAAERILSPESLTDFWRRLTIGGKWHP